MKKLILILISLCALPVTQTIGNDTAQAKPATTESSTNAMAMDNVPDTAFDTLSIEAGKIINYSVVFKKEKSHTYTIYISPDCGSVRCNKKQKGKSDLVTIDCIVTILKNPVMQNIKVILTDVDKKTNELKYRKVLQSYFVKERPEPVALTSNATSDEDMQAITQAEEESTQKEAVTPAPAEEKPTAPEQQTPAKPMDNAMPAQTPPAAIDTAAAKDSGQSTPENTTSQTPATPTGSESAMPTKSMTPSTTLDSETPNSNITNTSSTPNDASATTEQNSFTPPTDNQISKTPESETTLDTSSSSPAPTEIENAPVAEPAAIATPAPTTSDADMAKKDATKKPMAPSTGIEPIKLDTATAIPPVPAPTAA